MASTYRRSSVERRRQRERGKAARRLLDAHRRVVDFQRGEFADLRLKVDRQSYSGHQRVEIVVEAARRKF